LPCKGKEKTWELFNLINPIPKGENKESANKYRVEPYVMCADIYAVEPNKLDDDINNLAGRGGWSWLTGASAWMYKLIIEYLLGIKVEGDYIVIEPLMPAQWPSFSLNYRYKESNYQITVYQIAKTLRAQKMPTC
jgi:Cellobiose phosphorylase